MEIASIIAGGVAAMAMAVLVVVWFARHNAKRVLRYTERGELVPVERGAFVMPPDDEEDTDRTRCFAPPGVLRAIDPDETHLIDPVYLRWLKDTALDQPPAGPSDVTQPIDLVAIAAATPSSAPPPVPDEARAPPTQRKPRPRHATVRMPSR